MSMKKIKLFFEDTINLNSSVKKYYSDLIISYLDETYELSEDFGKVMMDEKNKDIMFSNEVIDNKLTNPIIISPNEEIMRKNISSSWSLTGIIERDEIPFFVIDTDGLKISNIAKMFIQTVTYGKFTGP